MKIQATVLALVLACAGCASQQSDEASATDIRTRNRDVLTYEEMRRDAPEASDVYIAVSRLRPHFLRPRNAPSMRGAASTVPVYIDRTPAGSLESLRGMQVEIVKEVRFLGASEATIRFGTGHSLGAIVITLK